ncbi:hypothetical protein UFOVP183_13 [uncultured Caudovirales phage]|jgi:hypothetical protein|uniref:Uncharacterized protein n=1 Tax=uncultured Caudovirales phage TaxID=2100421 RepID=A0A6J7WHL5_9CAUD|nr:hypothetical protein UFOVP183_13 [uncultured Caudovirales phage]
MTVDEAIAVIVETYGDINLVARTLIVDASEVAKATAEPDTAEAIALELLKKYNPYTPKK